MLVQKCVNTNNLFFHRLLVIVRLLLLYEFAIGRMVLYSVVAFDFTTFALIEGSLSDFGVFEGNERFSLSSDQCDS